MNENDIFSKDILSRSVRATNGEFAWRKEDLNQAIDELTQAGKNIYGGEIWAVMPLGTDESVTKWRTSMHIDDGRLALGLIPDRKGIDGVYAWNCEARGVESLDDYSNKVKESSFNVINKMDPENNVSPEFSDLLYYNLTWD